MTTNSRITQTIGLVLLCMPSMANATLLKTPRPSHIQLSTVHDASSSSRKSSADSAVSLVTIRSVTTGISFKLPSDWKVTYEQDGMLMSFSHSLDPKILPSYLLVFRTPAHKRQTIKQLYNGFLEKTTITSTNEDPLGGDWYVPSFQLSSSGSTKILGMDALTLRYTGEVTSIPFNARRTILSSDRWTYTIALRTLPEFAAVDEGVFQGVVQTLMIAGKNAGTSSAQSKGHR